jgi:hypothetical protein
MTHVSIARRRPASFVERFQAWLSEWRRFAREVREQAELERRLRGVDDHLLRDMGLKWNGSRLERMNRDDAG